MQRADQRRAAHLRVCTAWARHFDGTQAAIVALLGDELHRLALAQTSETVRQDAGLRTGAAERVRYMQGERYTSARGDLWECFENENGTAAMVNARTQLSGLKC